MLSTRRRPVIVKTDGMFAALVETEDCLLLELTRQSAKRGDRNIIECRSSRCLASMGRRGNNNNISHHRHSATYTSYTTVEQCLLHLRLSWRGRNASVSCKAKCTRDIRSCIVLDKVNVQHPMSTVILSIILSQFSYFPLIHFLLSFTNYFTRTLHIERFLLKCSTVFFTLKTYFIW